MAKSLARKQLIDLCRETAHATAKRLREELKALEATFPELSTAARRRKVRRRAVKIAVSEAKRVGRLSEAGKKAIRAGLRRRWAAYNAAKAAQQKAKK